MKQFHKGKFIWIYHLERGTIFTRPQSIAAETWLLFQVWQFLYLIQISPEVRNEIENIVFKMEVTLSLPQLVNTSRQDNLADILQTIISNLFLSMTIVYAKVKQMRKYILRCRLQNRSYFASTTLRPRNMAAILQTIVWKQYFIHIAPKFGYWFGNVLCQMETTKNCPQYVNTVRPRQCERHFTDNVFKLNQIAPNCIQTAPRFKNKFGSTLFQIERT